MRLKRYTLALDLIDDSELIGKYKDAHKKVWPEVIKSIKDSGIENMEIYNIGNRLFMIMEVNPSFSFENKEKMDNESPTVQEWEALMSKYQKKLPFADNGEKWVLMDSIFKL
ncbi:L-rhamnose mutarotase [Gramella sp. AN32]|uniref:L-rhamnose mutarotase n=1 Tax=Christiangramia antarctica TaxID=2058158 RepID=A0ABW5X4I1_9FLAO|nr:L-rhamnose mutarotase [Gramella sp. AN32]MCM4156927.1 L-fucose mutarotase [Gramella sp. AN32]